MNQPVLATPVFIPAQPAKLQLGARTLTIPSQRMSRDSRKRRDVEMSGDNPDRIVLLPVPPSKWSRLTGHVIVAILLFVAAMIGAMAVFVAFGAVRLCVEEGVWWVAGGLPCILWSLSGLYVSLHAMKSLLLDLFGPGPRRFCFDRPANQLTIDRPFGVRGEYRAEVIHSLSVIVAVQLLCPKLPADDRFCIYEMNLVLDRIEQPRAHLTTHSDWQWMQQAGRKPADFLHVPVVD